MRYRSRTITNVLGYTIAITLMILVLSIGRHHFLSAIGILRTTGTHFMVFIPARDVCCDIEFKKGGPYAEGVFTHPLSMNQLKKIRQLPYVKDAAPYLLFRKYYRRYDAFVSIGGLELNSLATTTNVCAKTNVLEGRFLKPEDRDVVILEESFARLTGRKVNSVIKIFDQEFRIVGIVNCGIKPAKADMYASLKTVQRIASKYAACVGDIDMNIILVEVADAQKQEEVFLSVQKILKESTISSYNCYIPARDVMNILDKASWLITLIIIIAVTLFALKSQFASIIERTHEIGILKTLGWTNRSILEQILTESIVQAIVGGTIGCLFSIFVSMLFKELTIYWLSVGLGIILILLSGVVAGMFPALKAIRLNPVEAIRQPGGK